MLSHPTLLVRKLSGPLLTQGCRAPDTPLRPLKQTMRDGARWGTLGRPRSSLGTPEHG